MSGQTFAPRLRECSVPLCLRPCPSLPRYVSLTEELPSILVAWPIYVRQSNQNPSGTPELEFHVPA